MAELLRLNSIPGIQKDKLGSPSTGSEDGGNCGLDMAEAGNKELPDQDEFDGPALPNGILLLMKDNCILFMKLIVLCYTQCKSLYGIKIDTLLLSQSSDVFV